MIRKIPILSYSWKNDALALLCAQAEVFRYLNIYRLKTVASKQILEILSKMIMIGSKRVMDMVDIAVKDEIPYF